MVSTGKKLLKFHVLPITVQYSSKMKMRCVPILMKHYSSRDNVPELLSLGFATYLAFLRPVKLEGGKYYGKFGETDYVIQDDQASIFYDRWSSKDIPSFVTEVIRDNSFWGEDLYSLPGFVEAVTEKLKAIVDKGIIEVLDNALIKKETAAI